MHEHEYYNGVNGTGGLPLMSTTCLGRLMGAGGDKGYEGRAEGPLVGRPRGLNVRLSQRRKPQRTKEKDTNEKNDNANMPLSNSGT